MILKETLPSWDLSMYDYIDSEKKERNLNNVIAEGVISLDDGSDCFRIREAVLEVRRLGRSLTDEEMEKFRKR